MKHFTITHQKMAKYFIKLGLYLNKTILSFKGGKGEAYSRLHSSLVHGIAPRVIPLHYSLPYSWYNSLVNRMLNRFSVYHFNHEVA